jgi:hypothetical protein
MSRVNELSNDIILWRNGELFPAIIHTLITFVGVIGHVTILASQLNTKIPPTMMLTISLVVSDLVFLFMALVVNIGNLTVGGFYGGKQMCIWESKIVLVGCFASVFALLSTTFERYLYIVHQKNVSKAQVIVWIACLWMLSFCISWLPVFFGYQETTFGLNSGNIHCVLAWWSLDGPGGTFTLITCLATLITFLSCSFVMMYCYYSIVSSYIQAKKKVQQWHQQSNFGTSIRELTMRSEASAATQNSTGKGTESKDQTVLSPQERQLLKKAMILTFTFFCCWGPYFVKVDQIDADCN